MILVQSWIVGRKTEAVMGTVACCMSKFNNVACLKKSAGLQCQKKKYASPTKPRLILIENPHLACRCHETGIDFDTISKCHL